MTTPVATIIMPCWKRPERTRRAIMSVLNQTERAWELLCIGDACDVLPTIDIADPRIIYHNMPTHEGAYGTQCLNYGLSIARGAWVLYLGNDDYVLPTHLMTRLGCVDESIDFAHFDALIATPGGFTVRKSGLSHGSTGGSELIVRTELARKVGFKSGRYGHDWDHVFELQELARGYAHSELPPTYVVTHLPGNLNESGID